MFLAMQAPATGFQRTKVWVVTGVTLGFLVWFFGFMVVGGEYFRDVAVGKVGTGRRPLSAST